MEGFSKHFRSYFPTILLSVRQANLPPKTYVHQTWSLVTSTVTFILTLFICSSADVIWQMEMMRLPALCIYCRAQAAKNGNLKASWLPAYLETTSSTVNMVTHTLIISCECPVEDDNNYITLESKVTYIALGLCGIKSRARTANSSVRNRIPATTAPLPFLYFTVSQTDSPCLPSTTLLPTYPQPTFLFYCNSASQSLPIYHHLFSLLPFLNLL